MQNGWKELCRILGKIELALGCISSLVLAYYGGKTRYDYYNSRLTRDWGLTLIIFFASIFSFLLISAALFALSDILDNQETIYKSLKAVSDDISDLKKMTTTVEMQMPTVEERKMARAEYKPKQPQPAAAKAAAMKPIISGDGITCPVCGTNQRASRSVCFKCGQRFEKVEQ